MLSPTSFHSFPTELIPQVEQAVYRKIEDKLQALCNAGNDDTTTWTSSVYQGLDDSRSYFEDLFQLSAGTLKSYGNRFENPERLFDYTLRLWPEALLCSKTAIPTTPSRIGLILACESEWGNWKNEKLTCSKVMNDFWKLFDVKAAMKVLVYGCHIHSHPYDAKRLLDRFNHAINSATSICGEAWLFIGISPWEKVWNPQVHVLRSSQTSSVLSVPEWLNITPQTILVGDQSNNFTGHLA